MIVVLVLNLLGGAFLVVAGCKMVRWPERAIARSGAGQPRTTRIVGIGLIFWGVAMALGNLSNFVSE